MKVNIRYPNLLDVAEASGPEMSKEGEQLWIMNQAVTIKLDAEDLETLKMVLEQKFKWVVIMQDNKLPKEPRSFKEDLEQYYVYNGDDVATCPRCRDRDMTPGNRVCHHCRSEMWDHWYA